jgi:hypothetical protein
MKVQKSGRHSGTTLTKTSFLSRTLNLAGEMQERSRAIFKNFNMCLYERLRWLGMMGWSFDESPIEMPQFWRPDYDNLWTC